MNAGALRRKVLKLADAMLGQTLCRLIALVSARPEGAHLRPMGDIRRILVVRPGGLGDMILLLPMLHELCERWPRARIDIVCERRNRAVLDLAQLNLHPLQYDASPLRFVRALRTGGYDIVVDTEQFHCFSAIFAWIAHAPIRIGFKINPVRNPLYTHLVDYALDGYEGCEFQRLLNPLGIETSPRPLSGLLPAGSGSPPATSERAKSANPGPLALHIGASDRHKQWPPERYRELLEKLAQFHDGEILALSDPKQPCTARRIVQEAGLQNNPRIRPLPPQPLRNAADLLARSRLFIGCDTGLAHLAIALGTPSVILFGPSDHRKWGVQQRLHRVVRRPMPCAPCFIFGYRKPCRKPECMSEIDVETVLDEIRTLLDRTCPKTSETIEASP